MGPWPSAQCFPGPSLVVLYTRMAQAVRRGKVPYAGGLKDAVLVSAKDSKEPWTEYHLEDGTILKTKQVVSEIWRVDGEYDAEGSPVYVVKTTNMVNVTVPDELRKKGA